MMKHLSHEERAEAAKKLAEKYAELQGHQANAKKIRTNLGARETEIQNEIRRLAVAVNTGVMELDDETNDLPFDGPGERREDTGEIKNRRAPAKTPEPRKSPPTLKAIDADRAIEMIAEEKSKKRIADWTEGETRARVKTALEARFSALVKAEKGETTKTDKPAKKAPEKKDKGKAQSDTIAEVNAAAQVAEKKTETTKAPDEKTLDGDGGIASLGKAAAISFVRGTDDRSILDRALVEEKAGDCRSTVIRAIEARVRAVSK